MSGARPPRWSQDLFIPIAALLVIVFSLSTVFFDDRRHLTAGAPHHVLKAYRSATAAP